MQSFLIAGQSVVETEKKAREIAKNRGINDIDISLVEFEKALGIEDFRNVQKSIFLKPIRSSEKAVIINLQNGASIEAQSAMLKILEEPPAHTVLILLSPRADSLLPTILSRCLVLEIKSEENVQKVDEEFEEILKGSVGAKLVAAQNLSREKDTAINFVKGAIFYTRSKMKKGMEKGSNQTENLRIIKQLQKAYYYLSQTNVNPRMTLENLFLNLS